MSVSRNKNGQYGKILDWQNISNANELFNDFHNNLQRNRIFLSPELKDKFDKIDDDIWSVWVSNKVSKQSDNIELLLKAHETSQKSVRPLMKEIENLVQLKLFPNDK